MDSLTASPALSTRGYTGHEMEDEFGLINMNARLYDPLLGRFIGADSVIPDVFNGESLNPYSYVLNNPFAYTDPSGHEYEGAFGTCSSCFSFNDPGSNLSFMEPFGPNPAAALPSSDYWMDSGAFVLPPGANSVGMGDLASISWEGMAQRAAMTHFESFGQGKPNLDKAKDFALGFVPAYDLYQATQNPDAGLLDYAVGILGVAPGLGKLGGLGLKYGDELLEVAHAPSTADRIRSVAQQGFDYAVANPRVQDLNRMQLGKDAEVEATRWLRRWAERNDVLMGNGGLQFQVRGAASVPDVVFHPSKDILDFKLTPKAVRAAQTANFGTDFPGYDIDYIFGPGPWR